MLNTPEYCQAVARGIDAEEAKARLFIHHNDSLGSAREAILRDVLVKHTPEPYKVRTGFIYQGRTSTGGKEGQAGWAVRQEGGGVKLRPCSARLTRRTGRPPRRLHGGAKQA